MKQPYKVPFYKLEVDIALEFELTLRQLQHWRAKGLIRPTRADDVPIRYTEGDIAQVAWAKCLVVDLSLPLDEAVQITDKLRNNLELKRAAARVGKKSVFELGPDLLFSFTGREWEFRRALVIRELTETSSMERRSGVNRPAGVAEALAFVALVEHFTAAFHRSWNRPREFWAILEETKDRMINHAQTIGRALAEGGYGNELASELDVKESDDLGGAYYYWTAKYRDVLLNWAGVTPCWDQQSEQIEGSASWLATRQSVEVSNPETSSPDGTSTGGATEERQR